MNHLINNRIYQPDIIQSANMKLSWEKFNSKTLLITGATGMIARSEERRVGKEC